MINAVTEDDPQDGGEKEDETAEEEIREKPARRIERQRGGCRGTSTNSKVNNTLPSHALEAIQTLSATCTSSSSHCHTQFRKTTQSMLEPYAPNQLSFDNHLFFEGLHPLPYDLIHYPTTY